MKASVKEQSVKDIFQSSGAIAEKVLYTMGDSNLPPASRPKLTNLSRIANRAMEALRPKEPHDAMFEIAYNFLPEDFLKAEIQHDSQRLLIFATADQLDLLVNMRTWYVDGTFKVVKRPFVQLFSIHGFVTADDNENAAKQVPLVFVLMTRRQTSDYVKVFEALLDLLPRRAAVQTLVADFEKATWAAARVTIPGVVIRGCNFHWNQAIWRKVQEVGLQVEYMQKTDVYTTIRRVMALPFVPSDEVENCFNMIRVPEGGNEKMEQLCRYVDRNWIHSQTFPIQSWNVFGVSTRTNNDCEGWHRRLSHTARDTTPPFYVLVPLLHEEAKKLPLQKQMVEEGALTRLQRSATRQFQGKIFRLWSKYEAEIITCLELLNTISKINGPVL
ncbi:uncharacterized protein [Argopecten irradians]|uniref:uncharacterized protein n=1 Tax=Argopecten irradians TaxID=31199 RepID=UPI00371CCAE1